ncbi:hypothetical protein [Paracoccus sp. (in: a-proteobacteria)]|uniref:hypothetical protein n=1 Tax=Paracoccus sp. TaxID=267 RepID=UPI002AFDFA6B|nr:hypothetical protein [Paracoccus sp. (in: a-proteobacteria)]
MIAAFVEEYRKAFNAAAGDRSTEQDNARRNLKQIEKKIAGILAAIEDGMYHPSMKAKMADLESRRTRLTAFSLKTRPSPLPCGCICACRISIGRRSRTSRKRFRNRG